MCVGGEGGGCKRLYSSFSREGYQDMTIGTKRDGGGGGGGVESNFERIYIYAERGKEEEGRGFSLSPSYPSTLGESKGIRDTRISEERIGWA